MPRQRKARAVQPLRHVARAVHPQEEERNPFLSRPLQRGEAVRRLFDDYVALERDYARRTGIFPIMHLIGIRKDLVDENRDLIHAICDGFEAARRYSFARLGESQALFTMLPWGAWETENAKAILGDDFWAYGVEKNRPALDALCRYSHDQGIAPRRLEAAELFAPDSIDWPA